MKIKFLDERFNTPRDRDLHYRKHVNEIGRNEDNEYEFTTYEFETPEEYEEAADKFARTPASEWVEVFYGNDNRYHKYNKATGEFTSYVIENDEPINMTYHLFTPKKNVNPKTDDEHSIHDRWRREKNKYYERELYDGEDIV